MTFFLFFFLSGFCSLVYQVVWLRLAMAGFGVTTALVSIVLSVFMAGLALGSWGGGKLVRRMSKRSAGFFIALYSATELIIGISGVVVPPLLRAGRTLLFAQAEHTAWESSGYYLASAAWIVLVLLPFATCMGATFPLVMAAIRSAFPDESPRSFSFLYLANVLGATAGTLGSAFVFIELLGFSKTLLLAASLNALVAISAFAITRGRFSRKFAVQEHMEPTPAARGDAFILPLLFTSGLASLAMEVVWTRQFVPFLGPLVYSFATMLTVYLAATAIGSRIYRARKRPSEWRGLVFLAGCCALLPLLAADPRIPVPEIDLVQALRVVFGVGPFSGMLGFLTPMLLDRWSRGTPDRAGRAYAVNSLGCIAGPLLAGFVLLPIAGERWSLVLLAFPLFVFGLMPRPAGEAAGTWRLALAGSALVAALLVIFTRDFETLYPGAQVRRDHTATVIAAGQGMEKELLINGIGITRLTPITKMMVHMPGAFLDAPPKNILILCFGMGTTFRSALSWGVPVTVVDMVPSVPKLFGYFHQDADELIRAANATVVIDDARRFLERTRDTFDIIAIDPPPPVEAAGSSLLYSREFYQVVARRLRPGGVLQQWLPGAEDSVASAAAQALRDGFPEIRVFGSIEHWGYHFLASTRPLSRRSAPDLAAHLPPAAERDLLEWGPEKSAQAQFQVVVKQEIRLESLIQADPHAPMLTDDRPVNEYYFLRHLRRPVRVLGGGE
jgi:spermidine synthase